MGCCNSVDADGLGRKEREERDRAARELQDAGAVHIGPELTPDALMRLQVEVLAPVIDSHRTWPARGFLEQEFALVVARFDEVKLQLAAQTGSFLLSPLIAQLKAEIWADGTVDEVVAHACVELGVAQTGSLAGDAAACFKVLNGVTDQLRAEASYSDAEKEKFAKDLLLTANAPFDAGTPVGQLAAMRQQKLAPVLAKAERMKAMLEGHEEVQRKLVAVRERKQQLDVLIRTKQQYAPIPLITCHVATLRPATIAALVTPYDLPYEIGLLAILRGEAQQRVPCAACGGGKAFSAAAVKPLNASSLSRQASRSALKPVWCFESSLQAGAGTWDVYDSKTAALLEKAQADGAGALVHVAERRGAWEFVIDLDRMIQTSVKTGEVRKVMRHAPEAEAAQETGDAASTPPKGAPPQQQAPNEGGDIGAGTGAGVGAATHVADAPPEVNHPRIIELSRGASFMPDAMNSWVDTGTAKQAARTAAATTTVKWLRSIGANFVETYLDGSAETTGQVERRRRELLQPVLGASNVDVIFDADGTSGTGGVCRVCRGSGMMPRLLSPAQARVAAAPPPDNDERFDCCICMGDGVFCLSTQCREKHFFCADCIVGTLTAIVQTSQFPAHCPSCRAACPDNDKLDAEIGDEVLSFYELRGVISRELAFRFCKARDLAAGKISREKPSYTLCPANCGHYLLARHPSYADTLLYDTGLGGLLGETKSVRLGQCPCGALVCAHCEKLIPPEEEQSHMCEEALALYGEQIAADKVEAAIAAARVMAKKVAERTEVTDAERRMLARVTDGKECPGCGTFIQKAEGCHVMQCGGAGAHKDMQTCLRNGGCGHEFDWNTMKPLRLGKPGEPANERQVRFQTGWKRRVDASRTMLAAGSVVALHCTAHNRWVRMTDTTAVRGSPPKGFNALPGTWMEERFIVAGLSGGCVALWSPMHERFVRADGAEVNAKGGVKGVDQLPWHWKRERLTAVAVGNNELGLHSESSGSFLVMEADGRLHTGGPKVGWDQLQPEHKADERLRFRPLMIA